MDPFEALGLEPRFDIDLGRAEERHRELSRVLHPDRHVGKTPAERRMALGKAVEVNQAIRTLRDPVARATALLVRYGVEVKEGGEPRAAPEFLMEMMEVREELAEARAGRDRARVARLAADVRGREARAIGRFGEGFAVAVSKGSATDTAKLRELLPLLGELRYYRRFLDEVSAIEDDLLTEGSVSDTSSA